MIGNLRTFIYNNIKSRRVWDFIDLSAEKIYISLIVSRRINEGIKNISPGEIISVISELIDYEQEKINKIIMNNNGTEQ